MRHAWHERFKALGNVSKHAILEILGNLVNPDEDFWLVPVILWYALFDVYHCS
jgi:hypothetical protein